MKENESKKKTIRIILLNVAAMIAIAVFIIAGTMHWIKGYTMHGQYIQVPEICGMSEESAAEVLERAGLSYEISDIRFDKSMKAGMIIEQNPKSGSNVKEGRKIYLVVNSGNQPTKAIPDLTENSSLREAQARLKALGFHIDETERVDGDLDWVYGIKYDGKDVEAGAQVPEGSTLTIVAGNGNMILNLEQSDETDLIDDSFFDSRM
ncbi:MAG: PASTA domain-containing protein [Bacteroidaceae bacterium]|nr:PASTA domain-containing protein [Bacteroidaceae bacterium]